MMPAPYDPKLAIARLQTDSTDALRARYPHLCWVWDELDELRDTVDNTDTVLADFVTSVENAVLKYEDTDEPDAETLIANLKELIDDADA